MSFGDDERKSLSSSSHRSRFASSYQRRLIPTYPHVVAGLVPAIHVFDRSDFKTWMPATSAGMTVIDTTRGYHTSSKGTAIVLRFSSHSGTGRFLPRMKSGLNSFD